MNTSIERVDWLIERTDEIHHDIDQAFDGEIRYNRMLRVGMNALAIALKEGRTVSEAGALLLAIPLDNPFISGPLDTLADDYAKVERATLDNTGKPETDARHAIHLMKLAPEYASHIYPELDGNKIAAYGFAHDLIESRSGDVSSLGMTPEQEAKKHRDEAAALESLRKEFGDTWPELIALIDDYEALKDAEACFNKSADKLAPGFTHFHNKGFQLIDRYGYKTPEELLRSLEKSTQRMLPYAEEFPLLMQDREELTRRIIDVTYKKAA